jgi:type I restriction-modification system DNA methylase subunit
MPSNNAELEKNLWDAADELRANSRLRAADYSIPVLGLVFLKHADHRFAHATEQFKAGAEQGTSRRRRDPLSPDRYKAAGVLYLPDEARCQHLVQLPEGEHVGRAIESQGWSLNPGRYVGVAEREEEIFDFAERLTGLHEELEVLNAEAHELEARIAENVAQSLGNL